MIQKLFYSVIKGYVLYELYFSFSWYTIALYTIALLPTINRATKVKKVEVLSHCLSKGKRV